MLESRTALFIPTVWASVKEIDRGPPRACQQIFYALDYAEHGVVDPIVEGRGFLAVGHHRQYRQNTAGARNVKTYVLARYAALEKDLTMANRNPVISGTLAPGVYTSSTGKSTVTGTLTLDAKGDSSARFTFRAGTITIAARSNIVLTRWAQTEKVYWRSTGTVTLGASSTARGAFLANTDASIESRAKLVGRLYCCAGSITVTRATISMPP